MDQPVPNVSRADVERIVKRDFASADVSIALAILNECRKCHTGGDSPARVQLAVLKLAGGDVSMLRRGIEIAKSDYRDVLAPAEYPRYCREIGFDDVSDSVLRDVIDEDWQQYENWLRR